MKSSKLPSVCVSEVLTCCEKERDMSLRKSKEKKKEAFKSRATCDYREGAVIQYLAAYD